jgi:plasmid stabilization system protein ParE
MPDIGTRWLSDHAALQDVRYYHVEDFPNHLVFYRKVADAVEVLHVFHGARNIDDLLTPEG